MRCVGAILMVVGLLGAVACSTGATPGPTAPSAAPTVPSAAPTAVPSVDGGALAEAVVAKFAADPFIAHVDQTGTVTSQGMTGHVDGSTDVNGDDLRMVMLATGEGIDPIELEVVILGDDVWYRLGDQTNKTTRGAMAEMVAFLQEGYRVVRNPEVLTYAGTEMIDGRELHHLTAPAGAIEYSDSNTKGFYSVFDLYALADGTPVLVRGAFTAKDDDGSEGTGSTEMRFSGFGGPISIEAPSFGG